MFGPVCLATGLANIRVPRCLRGTDMKIVKKTADVVLVLDQDRVIWIISLELYPGRDGHARVAKNQRSGKTLLRICSTPIKRTLNKKTFFRTVAYTNVECRFCCSHGFCQCRDGYASLTRLFSSGFSLMYRRLYRGNRPGINN